MQKGSDEGKMDKLKDSFKTFPECENCKVFKRNKTSPKRALICETARATGICPKDLWKKQVEKKLRDAINFYIESGSPKIVIVALEEVLG